VLVVFSALTLLVERQEDIRHVKNGGMNSKHIIQNTQLMNTVNRQHSVITQNTQPNYNKKASIR